MATFSGKRRSAVVGAGFAVGPGASRYEGALRLLSTGKGWNIDEK